MTVVHEVQQILWVHNKKYGDGVVLFLIDYGMGENTIWVIGFEDGGLVKHINSEEITLCPNHTLRLNIK